MSMASTVREHSDFIWSVADWRHERIVLESLNPEVPSITLTDAEGARVIAEFVTTL